MTPDPWRTPVILGVAQCTEHDEVVGPLDLAERAGRAALADASGPAGAAPDVDAIDVVGIIFGAGPAPASRLAERLGLGAVRCATTTIGGNSPQWLVGRAADDIAAGRVGTVLIAGAEAVRSQSRGVPPAEATGEADPVEGDSRVGLAPAEMAAGLLLPAHVYPLFESVLAGRAGRSPQEQRDVLGRLMGPFSEVAAGNPHAWFRDRLSPEQIATPGPDNRLTAEPYTKRMNAFLQVDQAAAMVMTSYGRARALGLADQAVFVWSVADAHDVWFPSARPDLGASPAIAAAAQAALGTAGVGVDDLAMFDLYSCFPSAVQIAADALGVSHADARGLTVTGGLAYFGGPGNNYTTHAIVTLAERLRAASGATLGLVSGLGWYITKHALGVYGSRPPPGGYRRGDTNAAQARIDRTAVPVAEETAAATADVEASTVLYGRSGEVTGAPVIARLADGRRVVAKAAETELAWLRGRSLVGCAVDVEGRPPTYRVAGGAGTSLPIDSSVN